MFTYLSEGKLKRAICETDVLARREPKDSPKGREQAEAFVSLVESLPIPEHRQRVFMEVALYADPNCAIKEPATQAWARQVEAIALPSFRRELAMKAIEFACFNELAPGLRREHEHTRADDEAYGKAIITSGVKIVFANFNEDMSRRQCDFLTDRITGMMKQHAVARQAFTDAMEGEAATQPGIAQKIISGIKKQLNGEELPSHLRPTP